MTDYNVDKFAWPGKKQPCKDVSSNLLGVKISPVSVRIVCILIGMDLNLRLDSPLLDPLRLTIEGYHYYICFALRSFVSFSLRRPLHSCKKCVKFWLLREQAGTGVAQSINLTNT